MQKVSLCTFLLICTTIISDAHAATYEQEVLADNPFVYYRFDETTGDVAADSSGNGHDGTYLNVDLGESSASPGLGTAARFDGQTSLVEVPALEFESEALTIETWLNVDFIVGACCTSVFSPGGWQPGWLHYNLGEPGRVEFALNSGGPNDRWTFADALPLEEWAHVVSTYDADEALARIFINGEEVEFDIPDFSTPQTVLLIVEAQIGAWQNSRYLSGAIDEFAIYDSVLSDERIIAHFNAAFGGNEPGDFDGNGVLELADIDALLGEVAAGTNSASFDMNGDALVNGQDIESWVRAKGTWIGDANLDGEFNSSDLVDVLAAGEYEDAVALNSGWAEGDFSGDREANSSDLVVALADGGYEQGPPPVPAVVPEPQTAVLLVVGVLAWLVPVRRARMR